MFIKMTLNTSVLNTSVLKLSENTCQVFTKCYIPERVRGVL